VPGRKEPIILAHTSKALLMVTHMRDETHRFAISYHRNVRKTAFKQSALDEAPGIGEGRKKALLKHFGSLRRLLAASQHELAQVEGMGSKLSEQLFQYLQAAGALAGQSEQPAHGQQIVSQQEEERTRQRPPAGKRPTT